MLMAGKQVTQPNDPLYPVDLQRIHRTLIDATSPVADKVRQLRTLKSVQPDAYRRAKTGLPYIVTAAFTPPIRNKANFSHAEHFIIDIDHIADAGQSRQELKSRLIRDPRVLLLFTSPGNDGLKLLFRLSRRLTDAGLYSTFYKLFTASFAEQYNIVSLIDRVTHDVSRCCFMSYDPEAYLNADAEAVDPDSFARFDDLGALHAADREMKRMEAEQKHEAEVRDTNGPSTPSLSDDVLERIRQRLSPHQAKRRPEKTIFQPSQLLDALPGLQQALAANDITLAEHRPIHYGRQLKLTAGPHWAEVNLFYGRNSFRAVMTTKTGSNPRLAELGRDAVQLYFDELLTADPMEWPGRNASL
jgi:hypothetical protein